MAHLFGWWKSKQAPKALPQAWQLTEEGALLFDGRHINPRAPWTKKVLVERLRRMEKVIAQSEFPFVTIEAMAIEQHIAACLWHEVTLTFDHLVNATIDDYRRIIVQFDFDGTILLLQIQHSMYYEDYQFIVKGHPDNIVCVRDVPDALARVSNEHTF